MGFRSAPSRRTLGPRTHVNPWTEPDALNPSLRYLLETVPGLPADAEAVAARLREAEYEVVRIAPLSELLEPVVVARVTDVAQHPNADRLKVCAVDDGSGQPLQVVTGAGNVRAGAFYPLIRSGVSLPSGRKIKRGKLRGEASEGMLGSPDELELGSGHDGLLELSGEPAPGTPLPQVLPADGVVFVLAGNPALEEVSAALRGEKPEPEASGEDV